MRSISCCSSERARAAPQSCAPGLCRGVRRGEYYDRPVRAPARFSEWQKGVVDGHMDGPPGGTQAPAAGATCVTTRRIGGASRRPASELVHIDPPRTWGVRGTDGPVRAAAEVLAEPLTGSRNEMPANVAALRQQTEAG